MRYYVVSDVHDHYDLMMATLRENGFDLDENNKLIVCGDAFYSGPQPGELFVFLRDLWKHGRLIFVYGNHDIELLDNLRNGCFQRPANRRCAALLVKYLTGKNNMSDFELISECKSVGLIDFLKTVPVWYYETKHYIFTHGFIPTEKYLYKPDWRQAGEKEWRNAAARGDAMKLSLRYCVREPNKKIVCGHYSAARCYLMKAATNEDWNNRIYKDVSGVPLDGFRPFYGDSFIALDASTKKTGFVNCIIIEE